MDQKKHAGRRSRKGVSTLTAVLISVLVIVALISALAVGNLTPILTIVAIAAVVGLIN